MKGEKQVYRNVHKTECSFFVFLWLFQKQCTPFQLITVLLLLFTKQGLKTLFFREKLAKAKLLAHKT